MLDVAQLREHIRALHSATDSSLRPILQALRRHEEQEWSTAPPEVLHALTQALQQQLRNGAKQFFLRQEVVTILGNLGPHSDAVLPHLIEVLQADNPDGLREAAATALGKMGKGARGAVGPLCDVLVQGRAGLAIHAACALSAIGCGDQRVRTALVTFWLLPNLAKPVQVRVAAALCKLRIDAPGVLKFLTSTLVEDASVALRTAAAEALACCDPKEVDVVPALLVAALNDKNEDVRHMAETGLQRLRLSQQKATLLCCLQLKDSCYAELALRQSGRLGVSSLIEALNAEEPALREKAIRILSSLGEGAVDAVPALTAVLHDQDRDVRLAAAKGLWNITKQAEVAVPVLVDLLGVKWAADQASSESRRGFLQTVIEALRRIGPPAQAAAAALLAKTKDQNRLVSESAFRALHAIAPAVAARVEMH
jgi:HEAT repeat protein